MNAPTIYVSLPEVLLDGQRDADLSENVVAVLVEENIDGLFRSEIILNNFGVRRSGGMDYLFFDRDKLDFGKEIGLRLGPGSPAQQVFAGRITGLEAEYPPGGNSRIVVLAEDRLQDLRMTRRTRSFEDLSDSDVINQIVREHGLVADVNVTGERHKSLAQVNQSDLAFIRERARAVNAEVWVTERTLHVKPRTQQSGSPIELAYGVSLTAFQVRADLAHQCTELRVSGWDVAGKQAILATGTPSLMTSELENEQDGGAILKRAFGERKAAVVHTVPLTNGEAQSIAQARYRERARRFVTGSGEADGDARIRVGVSVKLSGLGRLFDGKYYVTRVRHLYDVTNGFRTEFDVERPGIGG